MYLYVSCSCVFLFKSIEKKSYGMPFYPTILVGETYPCSILYSQVEGIKRICNTLR